MADRALSRTTIKGLIELVITVAVAVGAALLLEAFVVKPYRIPSTSMVPTLVKGQRILVNRLTTHPGVGDVVVFHPPAGIDRGYGSQCGDPEQGLGGAQPCDHPTRRASSQTLIKRVVGRRATRSGSAMGPSIETVSRRAAPTYSGARAAFITYWPLDRIGTL